jgi:aldehyde:ferredoxin oxidoreductase
MQIWRINAQNKSLNLENVPEKWARLGGRGLIAQILLDEVPPACDPLGPNNKLILASGLFCGYNLSSLDRISAGGKSPLTGGVKESNAGGTTGLALTRLGIKALILEGFPQDETMWMIHINPQGIRFEPAGDLAGLGIYECAARLRKQHGEKAAMVLIGPAGEMQMISACISHLDMDGVPSRVCGRGGLGALMGSKKIKAIIIDPGKTEKPLPLNPEEFKSARQVFVKAILDHPQSTVYREYGTAAMVRMCNSFGALPTRGFSNGTFESAEKISGEALREMLEKRGGVSKTTHACMPGCIIQCSNVVGDETGEKVIVAPLEYETIGLMGSNLGLDNLDIIARLNWEANDIGVDTIETGAAMGVAAQAGLMTFGDGQSALALMDHVRQGTPTGRIIGNGAAVTGRVFGIRRVPVVKNQAFAAYDPRAIKGTGVTYATTPMGSDHTNGLTIRGKVDHTKPEGQVALSRGGQINNAGYDTLGACSFTGFGFSTTLKTIGDLLHAIYNWEAGENALQDLGRKTLSLEHEFNRLAGFTSKNDRMPEWVTQEPLSPTNAVFDVPDQDLDSLYNW